jgi:tetratricopeptide (TPR) repeat protein
MQKIFLIFLGILLSLVLLELGLRSGGFIISSIQEFRNRISIQKRGAFRILCLGESTTAGQYPFILEEILNQHNLGIKFSVIDRGIPGTNTSVILSQLESNLNKYKPDMVITMMGINDSGSHLPYDDIDISRAANFFKSLRVYKLARLLELHLVNQASRVKMNRSSDQKKFVKEKEPNLTWLRESVIQDEKTMQTADSLKKAIELNPKDYQAYIELGLFYKEWGDFLHAEELFKKAVEINPRESRAYLELGEGYRNQWEFAKAEPLIKRAIELNPQNSRSYIELACIYRAQGRSIQTEELFKKAIEINPQDERGYIELGCFYRDHGRYFQAERLFKKAIEINPRNAWLYNELGNCYKKQGKVIFRIEEILKKGAELNPDSDIIYAALANLYKEDNKAELMREYYRKADEIRSKYYNPKTTNNYREIKKILDKRGIKLVCVQYPMLNVASLKKIFEGENGVTFVDNEKIFKGALKKSVYSEYFRDNFGGDFGHCTAKGNRLLAENIANTIIKEYFRK